MWISPCPEMSVTIRKVNKIGLSTPSSLHLDEYIFISRQLPIAFFETDAIMSVAMSCPLCQKRNEVF